jgi:hypothetical protein
VAMVPTVRVIVEFVGYYAKQVGMCVGLFSRLQLKACTWLTLQCTSECSDASLAPPLLAGVFVMIA